MPPAATSGWLRFCCTFTFPTAQHNTYPGLRLPEPGGVRHKRKTALAAPLTRVSRAVTGDRTTAWAVTDEVPVRFGWLIPPGRGGDTFVRNYPARPGEKTAWQRPGTIAGTLLFE